MEGAEEVESGGRAGIGEGESEGVEDADDLAAEFVSGGHICSDNRKWEKAL